MALWVAIHGLVDGTDVVADTFNKPLYELAERTDYLYAQVQALYGSGTFESVRLPGVAVTGAVVGQVVYREPLTNAYIPAIASMQLVDNFTVADSSLALGVVSAITGATGTVVLAGKCVLTTGVVPWDMTALVQTGETFRAGPYYLSSLEAGRITANPSGPRIYVGTYGTDYAILAPQYRDTGEAHVHRTYALFSQPAGTQVVTNPEQPDGTHAIRGFNAQDPVASRQPRLVAFGDWTGDTTQYTVTMGCVDSVNQRPTDFSGSATGAMLYWTSSNDGSGSVRLPGFEVPVAIGTLGLIVALENPTGDMWDVPYTHLYDDVLPRQWVIDVPEQTHGWQARRYRITATPAFTTTNSYAFHTIGGPLVYADSRISDQISIACPGLLYTLDFTANPVAGNTTVLDTRTFEYTATGLVTDPSYLPVMLGSTAVETAMNLIDAIKAATDTIIPVYDAVTTVVYAGLPDAGYGFTTVIHLGSDISMTAVLPPGTIDTNAILLVYDKYNVSLLATGYWTSASYWLPVTLTNGLAVMVTPYANSGAYAGTDQIDQGSLWTIDVIDEAPGANFAYVLGMHPAMAQFYPPVPATAASFVLNGVELDPSNLFAIDPTYTTGTTGLYWYSNRYGMVPWPADWVSVTSTGSAYMRQNAVYHFVRNSGPSGIVTSLKPAANSPISVRRCNTADDATVGDLEIDLDLNLRAEDNNLGGFQVVKSANGQKLLRGPVVERLIAGPGISITQGSGNPTGQGLVTVGLSGAVEYTGDFDSVALQNAKEEVTGMFPYIRLLPQVQGATTNVPSGFICKFKVPYTLDPASRYRVLLYMSVFGEASVDAGVTQIASFNFSYSFLPDYTSILGGDQYTSVKSPYAPQGAYAVSSISVPLGGASGYTAFDPLMVHNDVNIIDSANLSVDMGVGQLPNPTNNPSVAFPGWDPNLIALRAGSLFGIRIQRSVLSAPTVAYSASLGFLNLRWKLVAI